MIHKVSHLSIYLDHPTVLPLTFPAHPGEGQLPQGSQGRPEAHTDMLAGGNISSPPVTTCLPPSPHTEALFGRGAPFKVRRAHANPGMAQTGCG